MFKTKLSIILLTLISALFILGVTKLSYRVEAQINGFGGSCQVNKGSCGSDTHLGDISSNIQYVGLSSSDFQTSLNKTYVNNNISYADQLCARTNLFNGSIIRVNYTNSINPAYPAGDPTQNLVPYTGGGFSSSFYVPRVCPSGKTAIQSSDSVGDGAAGCCPNINYVYTTGSLFNSKNGFQNFACCPIKPGTKQGDPDYPVYYNGGKCQGFVNGNLTDIDYSGISAPVVSGADAIGTALGTESTLLYKATITGPDSVCPTTGDYAQGCALIDNATGDENDPLNIKYNGNLERLTSTTQLSTNTEAKCVACFAKGEPMVIEGKNLILCNNGQKQAQALINNSIADTIAYLSADSQENKDFIKNCTAGGGIPTAIGCVDASPLGIITGLIRIALGVVGGIALLQLILVGIQYQRGEEAEIKKARDRLFATLTGVAVLVFSVLILRILGVNILDVIPAGSVFITKLIGL